MAILEPRRLRSSGSDISPMSRPWNLMRPPTILPMLDRSRMMPRATVDLPQPDSPTMPIASPGMTVQEKSITAGISKARAKNEIDRFSISRMGSFRATASSMAALVLQRLFAHRIGQQVEAEHQRHQRDRRRQALPEEQPQLRDLAAVLDRG